MFRNLLRNGLAALLLAASVGVAHAWPDELIAKEAKRWADVVRRGNITAD